MPEINNPLELYKLLEKTNCRECALPSCMAFAAAVFQGQKSLDDCPYVDATLAGKLGVKTGSSKCLEDQQQENIDILKRKITGIDLASAAERLGGRIVKDKLAITCLGKDFLIGAEGEMSSECHNNLWVNFPLLIYITEGKGSALTGEWLPFNDLDGAADWTRFFAHRCEEDMRLLADAHSDLFFELLLLFGAKETSEIDADHALVLYPLPKVPVLIIYWGEEDGFESKLKILFDSSASDNLNAESIYTLCRGLVEMFRILVAKHNRDGKLF